LQDYERKIHITAHAASLGMVGDHVEELIAEGRSSAGTESINVVGYQNSVGSSFCG